MEQRKKENEFLIIILFFNSRKNVFYLHNIPLFSKIMYSLNFIIYLSYKTITMGQKFKKRKHFFTF